MEENIPYRRLKKLKANKISHSSERLLKPYRHQLTNSKHNESIMSQNVTQYQYMLSQAHLKQNYIKWATNLRNYNKSKCKQQENQQIEIPSVFYKKTVVQEIRQKQKEKNKQIQINTAQYSQFFGKNSVNIPANQINFMNNLRNLKHQQKITTMHQDSFKNYGYKDHNILPKLLKKTAIKKLRNYQQNDFQSSFDGTHMFPQYSYKKLREKNSALITALCKSHSNVSLPALAWQIGLRY